jgi:DNA-directed RNA polymerase I and III subunit RPAC2
MDPGPVMNATVNDYRMPPAVQPLEILSGGDKTNQTYIFGNEDHTLGNPLRHILMSRPETDFCGYSVPHPYEPKMNLRLQSRDLPANEVIVAGLNDLAGACDIMDDAFDRAIKKFDASSSKNSKLKKKTR